jgi:lipopolysaccharide heptosyltransferase II
MGDVVLTTPALRILKENFPKAEIHYCTKHSYTDLLKNNPDIDKLTDIDDELDFGKLKELRKRFSEERYDLIIDLHNNLRTFYLRLFLGFGSKVIKFKKYSFRKFLLVKFKINLMKELPSIAVRYAHTLHKLGIKIDTSNKELFNPEVYTDEPSKEVVEKILIEKNITRDKKIICIIPSAKHFTKTYPAEYYTDLINRFDKDKYCFVLIGKGNDKMAIDEIISQTNVYAMSFCDELNLTELTKLMKKCSLVVSGDTGPMHIAEALNLPLVMIAGSSVKEFGFFPQSQKAKVIENSGLSCRPCSHIGREKCPKSHFKCMKELKPEMVYERCGEMMGNL